MPIVCWREMATHRGWARGGTPAAERLAVRARESNGRGEGVHPCTSFSRACSIDITRSPERFVEMVSPFLWGALEFSRPVLAKVLAEVGKCGPPVTFDL